MNSKLIIEIPDGTVVENPDYTQMEMLRDKICDISDVFWNQGNGDMVMTHYYSPKKYYTLMIFPNNEHGIYLRYDRGNEEVGIEYLSLGDINKLGKEVAEYSFEMYASVGFFIEPKNAWKAVNHFCLTADKTTEIDWISCQEVPEECNY